jgi:hypothetical protein
MPSSAPPNVAECTGAPPRHPAIRVSFWCVGGDPHPLPGFPSSTGGKGMARSRFSPKALSCSSVCACSSWPVNSASASL